MKKEYLLTLALIALLQIGANAKKNLGNFI